MKYLLIILFSFSASFALCSENFSVPNTFKEGDIVSAEKMNQNFQSISGALSQLKSNFQIKLFDVKIEYKTPAKTQKEFKNQN